MPIVLEANNPDVLGIKFGPLANFIAMRDPDPNTLYFIMDKGLIFRGRKICTPINVTEATITGTGASQTATFTLTYYGDDPAHPTVVGPITVYTKTAIDAILNTLNLSLNQHKALLATATQLGHVKLSDAINDTEHDAAYGATHADTYAATPAAVAAALQAANEYTDTQISEALQSVHQKGTYGLAADGADESRPLNEIPAEEGDTYICISTINDAAYVDANGDAATYDLTPGDNILCLRDAVVTNGVVTTPARWTIVPNMSQNAVITENSETVLTANTLVLGAGQKKVKKLPAGTSGQMLRQGPLGPQWFNHINADHGIGYARCETPLGDPVKIAPFHGFQLVEGAVVSVWFESGIDSKAYLDVGDTDAFPIIYHNDLIGDGIISKGDTATFMFTYEFAGGNPVRNGEPVDRALGVWVVISVDQPHDVPGQLSAFQNNIQGIGVCNTATGNAAKTATITGVIIGKGSVFAIRFTYDVDSGSTLNINQSGAKNILHRNAALGAGQLLAGDTVTFISDGTSYHVLSIDRQFDQSPTANSHNLLDSNAVYQAIEAAKLKWEEF